MNRWSEERGSVTAFFAIITLSLILCAGLVLDGGRVLAQRRELSDLAGSAARAGAQAVSIDELRATGTSALDPTLATEAALAYLRAVGRTGTIDVRGDTVTVTMHATTPMLILGLAGVGARNIRATGSARTVRGLTEGDTT